VRLLACILILFALGCRDKKSDDAKPERSSLEDGKTPKKQEPKLRRAPPRTPQPADGLLKSLPKTIDELPLSTADARGNHAYASYMAPSRTRAIALNMNLLSKEEVTAFDEETRRLRSSMKGSKFRIVKAAGYAGYSRYVSKNRSAEVVIVTGRVRIQLATRPAKGQKPPAELIKTIDLEALGKF
jgi:hypothetical protein